MYNFTDLPLDAIRIIMMYHLTPFHTALFMNPYLSSRTDADGRVILRPHTWIIKKLFGAPGVDFQYDITVTSKFDVDEDEVIMDRIRMMFSGGRVRIIIHYVNIFDEGTTRIMSADTDLRKEYRSGFGPSEFDAALYRGNGGRNNYLIRDCVRQLCELENCSEVNLYNTQMCLSPLPLIKQIIRAPSMYHLPAISRDDHGDPDDYDAIYKKLLCYPAHLSAIWDTCDFFRYCELWAATSNIYGDPELIPILYKWDGKIGWGLSG